MNWLFNLRSRVTAEHQDDDDDRDQGEHADGEDRPLVGIGQIASHAEV